MARRGKRTLVRAAMGLLSVLTGMLLALRPFSGHSLLVVAVASSLVVAALAEIVQGTKATPARWVLGGAYLGGSVAVAMWPQISVTMVGVVVGALLVATGAMELWSALLTRVHRLPALLIGVADGGLSVALFSGLITSLLGVLAVLWSDQVRLPMVIALGIRLVMVGFGLLVDIWYPPTDYGASTETSRLLWRGIGLGLAIVVFVVGLEIDNGRRSPSEFYQREVAADAKAGQLLRADADPSGAPAGGSAVRLMYSTLDPDRGTVAASAALYVPDSTTASALQLVVWAHPESGIAAGCAPSITGEYSRQPTVLQLLAAGYAVLAPDYVGLGVDGPPSFLVGVSEARALLDAVRAAGQVPGVRIGSTVIWGYSQGGHAALWAAELAASYAPELKIVGIAALTPIADPGTVLAESSGSKEASNLATYLLYTYASRYPDVRVEDYLSPTERALADEVSTTCGQLNPVLLAGASLMGLSQSGGAFTATGALAERLGANTPSGTFSAPLLVTQGAGDQVVPLALQNAEVARRCQAGQLVDYRVYPGADHTGPAPAASTQFSELMSWTTDRFAGRPAPSTCR